MDTVILKIQCIIASLIFLILYLFSIDPFSNVLIMHKLNVQYYKDNNKNKGAGEHE